MTVALRCLPTFSRNLLMLVSAACFGLAFQARGQDKAQLQIKGSTIDISLDPAPAGDLRKLVLNWIETAARAVTVYYERYPVGHVSIDVNIDYEEGVHSGRASGWDGAQISISVGRSTTAAEFSEDWIMTHEMVHLAFPAVPRSHHCIEEGLAT